MFAFAVWYILYFKNREMWGTWVAQLVEHLPSAQVMIPEFWDGAPHQTPCLAGSLLLPLPLLLPLLVLSLALSNK